MLFEISHLQNSNFATFGINGDYYFININFINFVQRNKNLAKSLSMKQTSPLGAKFRKIQQSGVYGNSQDSAIESCNQEKFSNLTQKKKMLIAASSCGT